MLVILPRIGRHRQRRPGSICIFLESYLYLRPSIFLGFCERITLVVVSCSVRILTCFAKFAISDCASAWFSLASAIVALWRTYLRYFFVARPVVLC